MNDAQRMREYRRAHFTVRVEPIRWIDRDEWREAFKGEVALRVTQNGAQWQVMTFLPDEIPAVIAALQAALKPKLGKR